MFDFRDWWSTEVKLIQEFLKNEGYLWWGFEKFLGWAEWIKVQVSKLMYRQRGRFSQSFVNVTMFTLFFW